MAYHVPDAIIPKPRNGATLTVLIHFEDFVQQDGPLLIVRLEVEPGPHIQIVSEQDLLGLLVPAWEACGPQAMLPHAMGQLQLTGTRE